MLTDSKERIIKMQKIKTKKKTKEWNKEQEVKEIQEFLKNSMDTDSYKLFVKLGETDGNHITDMNQIIKDAQIIKNIKDKNQKVKLKALLEHNIKEYLNKVCENVVTQKPIENFIRIFIVNMLLCDYCGIKNTLFDKCKKVNLDEDYKKTFDIFGRKVKEFIKYDCILPEELIKKVKETNNHLSSCMVKMIKYNQSLFNIDKTRFIISNINRNMYYEYQKEYLNEEGISHSPEDSRLLSFIIYHFKEAEKNLKVKLYDLNEEEETKQDLSNFELNLKRVNKIIKEICNLINNG